MYHSVYAVVLRLTFISECRGSVNAAGRRREHHLTGIVINTLSYTPFKAIVIVVAFRLFDMAASWGIDFAFAFQRVFFLHTKMQNKNRQKEHFVQQYMQCSKHWKVTWTRAGYDGGRAHSCLSLQL
ncbi:hypothetical protein EG68_00388 [Paragonimus skrjabini miyazakii]|uniref:Uncharacterized protein n=1 Tax=Paragonimus skrjabini miyazakii TaxID=59628 RepID=A0A8S9Z5W7_9TREM|nr:hypothetical protein EG68_00388 [Paragonimus skrjabini miyazakii]